MDFEDYFNGGEVKSLSYTPKHSKSTIKDKGIKLTVVFVLALISFLGIFISAMLSGQQTIQKHTVKSDFSNKNAYLELIVKETPKVAKTSVKTSNLDGYNAIVEQYANKIGIDYKIPLAIMKYETGHFKSNAFVNYNNPAGIMSWKDGVRSLRKFESKQAGIEYTINLLKTNYIDKGLTTFEKIQPKYAPTSDGNSYWLSSVRSIYANL